MKIEWTELKDKYMVQKEAACKEYVCLLCYPSWTRGSTTEVKNLKAGRGYGFVVQHMNEKHKTIIEDKKPIGRPLFLNVL